MTTTTSTHYLVMVRIKAERLFGDLAPGLSLLPARNEWLSVDDGYASHTGIKARAHRFAEPPTPTEIGAWDGKPRGSEHDHRFKPTIVQVTETRTERLTP